MPVSTRNQTKARLTNIISTIATKYLDYKRQYFMAIADNPLTITSGRPKPIPRGYGLNGFEPWEISQYYNVNSFENDAEYYTYVKNYMNIRECLINVRRFTVWIKMIMDIKEKYHNHSESTIFNPNARFIFNEHNSFNTFSEFSEDIGLPIPSFENNEYMCRNFVNDIGLFNFDWNDFNIEVDEFNADYEYIMRLL